MLWIVLFEPTTGVLNHLLEAVGLEPVDVLGNPRTALIGVSLVTIWQNLGLVFVVTLAAMQSIPEALYESARVDGHGAWSRFVWITVPMLGPQLLFLGIVLTIGSFQAFAQVDLLTEGGPRDSTNVIVYSIVRAPAARPGAGLGRGGAAVPRRRPAQPRPVPMARPEGPLCGLTIDPSPSGHTRTASTTRGAGPSVRAAVCAVIVVAAVVLFPVYAAVMVAQKPFGELGDLGVLVPDRIDVGSVPTAVGDAGMGRYLVNSFIVATAITVGQVATSVLAGYALAAVDFAGRRAVVGLLAVSFLVPVEVTVVVNFETVQRLGGIDTYWALIVPFLAFPFGTFLMRQAFRGIPRDLRDAAAVDGYGHFGFLRSVGLPLVRPTVAALSLFSFLLAWNQYLWPLLVTNRDDRRTVQIGLEQLAGTVGPT